MQSPGAKALADPKQYPRLKAYVNGVSLKSLRDAIRAGDAEQVRDLLKLCPEMIDAKISGIDDRPLH